MLLYLIEHVAFNVCTSPSPSPRTRSRATAAQLAELRAPRAAPFSTNHITRGQMVGTLHMTENCGDEGSKQALENCITTPCRKSPK